MKAERIRLLFLFLSVVSLDLSAQRRNPLPDYIVKPVMEDTVKLNVYADNWFTLYINGKLVATDSIDTGANYVSP